MIGAISSRSSCARLGILALLALALGGCSTLQDLSAMTPTFAGKTPAQHATESLLLAPNETRRSIDAGPPPPTAAAAVRQAETAPPALDGTVREALSLEQVSLITMIDEVFAKALHLTVSPDPSIATRTDVVTLRTAGPLPAKELFAVAQKVLAGYGLAVGWDGAVLKVAPDAAMMAQMPELIRSRALPDLPVALRPIFQVVELQQVSAQDMIATLNNAFGSKVKLFATPKSNAVMVFGLPENVAAVVEAVHVLDQARLAGRQSLRFSPVYWTAPRLAAKLAEILRAEGYDASAGSPGGELPQATITLVPVESNNSLLAFAADPRVLAHLRQWATDLDQPAKADPSRNVFVYAVKNTTAASLGRTVQGVLGGGRAATAGGEFPEARLEQAGRSQPAAGTATSGGGMGGGGMGGSSQAGQTTLGGASINQAGAPAAARSSDESFGDATTGTGPRIVIDAARNALVFIGGAQDYERIRPVLDALDKPPREALIEVTVAEITLDDTNNLGIEWSMFNHLGGSLNERAGTGSNVLSPSSPSSAVGIPLGASGFNYAILNRVGDVRLVLNAFAQNNNVRVISTPRVLAKSGSQANIEVGTEVPIITSQGTTNQVQVNGTSGIIQSIEYQKTGVLLAVTPVVHSGDRIDLTVSQEVSQALPNTTPGITSPLIQNRNLSTQLTLADGATVVIGGLISENVTNDDSGVPFFKDVPGLGLLFQNQAAHKTRQELLVFITPYVISSDADSAAITKNFQDQMRAWPTTSGELHW